MERCLKLCSCHSTCFCSAIPSFTRINSFFLFRLPLSQVRLLSLLHLLQDLILFHHLYLHRCCYYLLPRRRWHYQLYHFHYHSYPSTSRAVYTYKAYTHTTSIAIYIKTCIPISYGSVIHSFQPPHSES